jgi:hypothetical protein
MELPYPLVCWLDISMHLGFPATGHLDIQLEYLVATVQGKLRSGRAGPFVKVEWCCD